MLKFHPCVFAVGKNYQIIVTTRSQSFISIRIGGQLFVDDSNGILRSASRTHKIEVPQDLLNSEKSYTVIEKCIIKRLAYFSKTRKDKEFKYEFRPVPEKNVRCYHIADAHNVVSLPVLAASKYSNIDFLILNGDIPNDSGRLSNFDTIFDIVSQVTGGNIPSVFARGNHDLRGVCAEKFADMTPCLNGKTYYSFRLGRIWGLCLDCGEDKDDSHPEYGCTVACHQFREKETDYINEIIKMKSDEYDAPDVDLKLVIAHNPFSHQLEPPFNIEKDIYTEWCRLLREFVKPDLMLCGHTHKFGIYEPGCAFDDLGQPCTMIVASTADVGKMFAGAGIELGETEAHIELTSTEKGSTEKHTVKYR